MSRSLCLTVVVAMCLGSAGALAQDNDLDGDGIADSMHLTLGFHPDVPVVGRVVVRSGTDNAVLLEIDGPTPGDAFGFSADFVPDMNGDGVIDLAVASPRAALTTDRVGRVSIYSGADGALIRTLFGRRGDRLGSLLSGAATSTLTACRISRWTAWRW